ncbi:DUF1028 domain-containing protein [Conexibacter sp. SYSU D00693]|uniref:DUF1028 domain-containing protein n=1 Tax=Conexibacter sp. SYSU D00693 TaxID=2812560 RepID=UPI00196B0CB2|nr:DUF1028 domain-containing protein [Conexibacter sp. SYSU D00693]
MTYSLVGRDPASGRMGVVVQSHWFSVGSIVAWARPGVGAVATQSVADPAYGPRMLDRLELGEAPREALDALLLNDEVRTYRQVGVLTPGGAPANHTGPGCIGEAGHASGPDCTAQANMMARAGVPEAMVEAFGATGGPLARRLLAAAQAAERAGGDVRGRQSATLVVVGPTGEPWRREVDLRIEDHPDPVAELGRLLDMHDAYAHATAGDELAGSGHHAEAGREYGAASRILPDNVELRFWAGLAQAAAGDLEAGAAQVQGTIDQHAGWGVLLDRLAPEIAPSAAAVRAALGRAG